MKKKQEMHELTTLSSKELFEKLIALRGELFSTRINSSTTHVKDYSKFKRLRRQIARVVTVYRVRFGEEYAQFEQPQ